MPPMATVTLKPDLTNFPEEIAVVDEDGRVLATLVQGEHYEVGPDAPGTSSSSISA